MPNEDWEFDVQRVSLNDLTIDAGQKLGMVIGQPFFLVDKESAPPFRIAEIHRKSQVDFIDKLFRIRKVEFETEVTQFRSPSCLRCRYRWMILVVWSTCARISIKRKVN